MPRHFLNIPSAQPGLTLEAILDRPQGLGPFPAVVMCHPHPLHGGSMRNNVLYGVSQALEAAGIVSLRFNFRGVGSSSGTHTGGPGEEEDARGALAFIAAAEGIDPARVGLAGYSFGARIAMAVASKHDRLAGLAVISSTSEGLAASGDLATSLIPKFFICGDRDTSVSVEELREFVDRMPEPKELQVIPGADHVWWRSEGALGQAVARFFLKALDGGA